ncbi:MAG: acylphosphatase [Planctomycetota bacterium]
MTQSRYDITFTGRVQGVNFRWTTCQVAGRFAVAGWVRNERDGSVRCVVEGTPGELEAFVAAVEEAMSGYVKDTRVAREQAVGDLEGFDIRS